MQLKRLLLKRIGDFLFFGCRMDVSFVGFLFLCCKFLQQQYEENWQCYLP